jgi:hypothetical protein
VSVCGTPRGRVARVPGPPTPVASPAGQRHLALEDLDQLVPRVTVERRRLRVRAHVLDHRDRVIPDRVESHQDAVAACAGERRRSPRDRRGARARAPVTLLTRSRPFQLR